jgi:hypothetical protein
VYLCRGCQSRREATAFSSYVNKGRVKLALGLYQDANPIGTGADNGFATYLGTQRTGHVAEEIVQVAGGQLDHLRRAP